MPELPSNSGPDLDKVPPCMSADGRTSTPSKISKEKWEQVFPDQPFDPEKAFYFNYDDGVLENPSSGWCHLYDLETKQYLGSFWVERRK